MRSIRLLFIYLKLENIFKTNINKMRIQFYILMLKSDSSNLYLIELALIKKIQLGRDFEALKNLI